jgi:uncharacterized membrane protein (UPF0136 family)
MRAPGFRRASGPAPYVATLCGIFLGLLTFVVAAWLYRTGGMHLATTVASAALLVALASIAGAAALDGPARMRRARVPIGRVLPPSWWPRESDSVPLIAACVGGPLVIGAGAAMLLFR